MRKNNRSAGKNAYSVSKNDHSIDKNACSVRKILFGIISYRTPVKTYEMMLDPIFSASSRISSGSL